MDLEIKIKENNKKHHSPQVVQEADPPAVSNQEPIEIGHDTIKSFVGSKHCKKKSGRYLLDVSIAGLK